MTRLFRFAVLWSLIAFAALLRGDDALQNSDDGMEGTIHLSIPEPMVFDLVRPLGARRGELEVNTLFLRPLKGSQHLEWAPEIEYVFAPGHAVEFELPAEGSRVTDYKLALQGQLPWKNETGRYVHGWQGIGEVGRNDGEWTATATYLSGVRWSDRWSSLSLNGIGWRYDGDSVRRSLVANNTLFYERHRLPALGFETNLVAGTVERRLLLMPQAHLRLPGGLNLQVGVGAQRPGPQRWHPVAGWRLIREFP